ncbi:periplasmic heavy metal sensor [Luteitalea sp.]|uniref:periplasmic heavy metal sensor n=1 Tax=Luteitalea sp. TaxID=2004800 RepID=UPI0025C2DC0B|nr:periplasmic heavy metal sensor [Luteitalea sp.]
MTVEAPKSSVVKPRRWPRFLLIASLALNALLIGAVARSLWHVRANIAITGGGVETSLPAFVSTLPAERREELRRAGPHDRPGVLRPLRMAVRRARAEAARLFVADPFDKAAFVAAQERLSEAETQLRQAVQRILPEIGERMTAAERRAYLSWRNHFGWGQRRGGGRGGDEFQPGGGPGNRGGR